MDIDSLSFETENFVRSGAKQSGRSFLVIFRPAQPPVCTELEAGIGIQNFLINAVKMAAAPGVDGVSLLQFNGVEVRAHLINATNQRSQVFSLPADT